MINIGTCLTAKGKRPMTNINLTKEALLTLQKCFKDDDATHREKYLKTYHGKAYIKKTVKILFNRVHPVKCCIWQPSIGGFNRANLR
jgi:hypothetical protein